MFRKTEISIELYEKEIKKLRDENRKLLARCESAEKYMNEYKELNKKSKKLIQEYGQAKANIEALEKEYEDLLNEAIEKSRNELRLKWFNRVRKGIEVSFLFVCEVRRIEYIKNNSGNTYEVPIWEKYTLSVQEAAGYFGLSDKKIRKIIDEHENDNFILWNGTRPRIKRNLFEKFVDEELTAV